MNVISMRRPHVLTTVLITLLIAVLAYLMFNRRSVSGVVSHDYGSQHMVHGHESRKIGQDAIHNAERPIFSRPKPSMSDVSPAWAFQPDFVHRNTTSWSDRVPRIPHIFHQVWDTNQVPDMYAKWMRTWLAKHPGWQHWFWTLEDARSLLAHFYPEHLTLYESYTSPIFRADMMRYFVLYHYGGVYVDLDMEALRPMDDWTYDYSCLVIQECYEHTFVVREESETNIMNGFIASSPQHPFLKAVIEGLDEAARKYFGDFMFATGPKFFSNIYDQYTVRMARAIKKNSTVVTLLPPYYFLPTYDPSESEIISDKCQPTRYKSLPEKAQIVCRELLRRSFHNTIHPLAYADHHWMHAYMFDDIWKKSTAKLVFDMVPGLKAMSTLNAGR